MCFHHLLGRGECRRLPGAPCWRVGADQLDIALAQTGLATQGARDLHFPLPRHIYILGLSSFQDHSSIQSLICRTKIKDFVVILDILGVNDVDLIAAVLHGHCKVCRACENCQIIGVAVPPICQVLPSPSAYVRGLCLRNGLDEAARSLQPCQSGERQEEEECQFSQDCHPAPCPDFCGDLWNNHTIFLCCDACGCDIHGGRPCSSRRPWSLLLSLLRQLERSSA